MIDGDFWLEPWIAVGIEQSSSLEQELRRECGRGHPLYRLKARALARREDQDDVLFEVERGGEILYATVHLTWRKERGDTWPWTVLHDDLEAWREQEMMPDHLDWKRSDAQS